MKVSPSGSSQKPGNMFRDRRHATRHICPSCSRGSGSSRHSSSRSGSSNRYEIMGRTRRRHMRIPLAMITLLVVLAGATAVFGSANSNPPPPPAWPADTNINSNNDKQSGWGRWVPPPPGPPPDIVPSPNGWDEPTSGNQAGRGKGPGSGDACGAELGAATWATATGQESLRHETGPAEGQTEARVGTGYAEDGYDGINREGERGKGGGGEVHARMMMRQQQQQSQNPIQEHGFRQHDQQLSPQPPSWGASTPHQMPTATPTEQQQDFRGQSSDGRDGHGRNGIAYKQSWSPPPHPPSTMFPSSRTGLEMMGGAGESELRTDDVRAGGMQKEPPSAASAGAITPQVELNQYRQESAQVVGEAHADETTGRISRALLSNTDKEIIFDGLKKLYRKKILPLEESSRYAHFHSPPMNPADFEAKPMVLIVGQYSVGKTSFIRSLLKRDFPGQRVGPEPTTDRFVAVTHGEDERVMPGHALAMQMDKPFHSLQQFGNNFLTKFEGAVVDAPILRNITLIDTPGVLSGEKQRIGRDYDFSSVISWFAERADLIVVMFDAHKLDISDELKMVIDALKPHHDKMRVLLNKADAIDTQQLMRVYGALMWSLGKVMQTPEVCRVYIGSFWGAALNNLDNRFLLEKEKRDLLEELMLLPENAVVRRINELVKRARSVKVHAYIIHYLRKQMPYVMGKKDKQERLIRRLDQEFLACARRYGLPLGDFPKVDKFRRSLREIKDISKFNRLDKSLVHEMDKVFSTDIPKLMEKAARPGR